MYSNSVSAKYCVNAGIGFNPAKVPVAPKVTKLTTPTAHKYSKSTRKTANIIKSFLDILNFTFKHPISIHIIL